MGLRGLGQGGQFQQAVREIINAEAQPIRNLENRKILQDNKLKLFGEFKEKFGNLDKSLEEFSSFRKFRDLKVELGNGEELMDVTLDPDKAEPGTYTVEVEALAERTSVISNGFESPTEKVLGIGYVVVNLPDGGTYDVFVDGGDSSLRGVARLINQIPDSPVAASVIKDATDPETPWKLLIKGRNDGLENDLEFPYFYFLDGTEDFYIDDDREAQNALMKIDGFEIEEASNEVPDFLQGVNIQLKHSAPDEPFTMIIKEDYEKISGKVKGLIDEVNQILSFIYQQNAVDENSDTRSTFAGDTSLTNLEFSIRNIIHRGFPVGSEEEGDFRLLFASEMGIRFERNGLVAFDEQKFQAVLESQFDSMAEAIVGPGGMARQLRSKIRGYTRPLTGILHIKENALRDRIKTIDSDIEAKADRLEKREKYLVERFARLEASLGALQQQQAFMSANLGSGGIGQLIG